MADWYILNTEDKSFRKAVTDEDKAEAYRIVRSKDKIVAQDQVGDAFVSTVFLGLDHAFLDHAFNEDRPVLFETLVMGDERDHDVWRYHTWQEAVAGHDTTVLSLLPTRSKAELEAVKAILEPLILAQEGARKESPAPEEPEQRIDHDDSQNHYKNNIDDLTNRGREWE